MSGLAAMVAVAVGEVGYTEQPSGSNQTKYGKWYGLQDEWCGIFLSWVANQSGNADVIPRFAWTPAGAEWFVSRHQWLSSPQVGDLAFYDVAGKGRISHVDLVVSVADNYWTTVGGNSGPRSDQVARNMRHSVGPLGGFGRPSYAGQAPAAGRPWQGVLLRQGNAGEDVRAAQAALSGPLAAGQQPPIEIDGRFGPKTKAAVLWFQRSRGLEVDGIIGPNTWAALSP